MRRNDAIFIFLSLTSLAGCAHLEGKQNAQSFVNCIRIGMQLNKAIENCAPEFKRTGLYFPKGHPFPYSEVASYCENKKFTCEPPDLSQLLHASSKTGPYGPYVNEPHTEFIRFGPLGVGEPEQQIRLFYSEESGDIIGWISSGKNPVRKQR